MYAVIFMDRKGAAMLGTFDDKGQCRRAWRTITTGAAVVDSAGSVLEYKTGTPDAAKRKLDAHAEWMKREGKLPPPGSAAPPEQPRATLRVKSIEVGAEEDEDDDEEDAPATKPAPAQAPVAPAATEVLAEVKWDSAPAGPEDFRGEDYPAEGPQPIVPERVVTAPAPAFRLNDAMGETARVAFERELNRERPPEVTHAVAPATGAVVQGDDTERLAPPAAEPPVTCAARGCVAHRGEIRSNTDPALAPLCGPHRKLCHDRARTMGTVAAVAEALVAGTLPSAHEAQVAAGKATAAAKRRAAPGALRDAAPAPKPRREPSPARTLAAGLETARACAEVVARLGGLAAARALAEHVERHGGAATVLEVLEAVAELGQVAAW